MNFQYVQPTEAQKILMQIFRDKFKDLAHDISTALPDTGRGKVECFIKLEEAAFWLNKAITEND